MDISVVLMTHNRAEMLRGSAGALLDQDFSKDEYEVLIVDDGSTDNTRDVAGEFISRSDNLRYIRQGHGGVSRARNEGLKNARGGIVAFIADDYIVPRDYLKTVKDFFEKTPDAKAVRFKIVAGNGGFISRAVNHHYDVGFRNSQLSAFKGGGAGRGPWRRLKKIFSRFPGQKEKTQIYYTLCASGAAAFRKEIFDEIGLFDEGLRSGEDSDMGIRLSESGIGIYYYPFLEIEHKHNRKLSVALKKWFDYGADLHAFKEKYPHHAIRGADNLKNRLIYLLNIFADPIWKARQAGSVKDFFLFLPVMFLINSAYTIGVFYGQAKGR